MDTEVPKLKRDWIGRKVRTTVELRNGWGVIPRDTVMTVQGNRSGLELIAEPCEHCGVRLSITRVSEYDVLLLPVGATS
jgi:hypothetical protein